jgi:hypothetical protein
VLATVASVAIIMLAVHMQLVFIESDIKSQQHINKGSYLHCVALFTYESSAAAVGVF